MKNKVITIILLIFSFVIYFITSSGNTPYDYFNRLADSFLSGKYYLDENPAWLNELIPLTDNRYAVVYPPGPSIILMPLRFIFGDKFQQQYLAHILGALFAVTTAKIALKVTSNKHKFIWVYLLAAFGNIVWFLSASGSVWYLGQISGAFFLTATILESMSKKRPVLISIFFAMAVLSRIQTILAFPLVIFLNKKSLGNFKEIIKLFLPFSILMAMFAFYNYLRFGSFIETGYSLIPGVLNEPWYSKGIFHPSYIENNLRVMFLSLPIVLESFPYIKPSWGGLSILITTPAFLYILYSKIKDRGSLFAILSLLLIALVTFSHGGTGFTQFGYRYAVDFYPLIFFLLIKVIEHKNLKWHYWFLLFISITVNLWGVIWINKFDWVSF